MEKSQLSVMHKIKRLFLFRKFFLVRRKDIFGYLWLGFVPLTLAGVLIYILYRELDRNTHKLAEHLMPEAVGLLVGIPLVYLIVEATLQRREVAEWDFGRKRLTRHLLEVGISLSHFALASCARHLIQCGMDEDLHARIAGIPENISHWRSEFVQNRDALVSCMERYSSKLKPEDHLIISMVEDALFYFSTEELRSRVVKNSNSIEKSLENLIFSNACFQLSSVLDRIERAVNALDGNGMVKVAIEAETTTSPFEEVPISLLRSLNPREELHDLDVYGFYRASKLREFAYAKKNAHRCLAILHSYQPKAGEP